MSTSDGPSTGFAVRDPDPAARADLRPSHRLSNVRMRILATIAAWTILYAALRVMTPWFLRTNDDLEMLAIVSGLDGGEPSPHLMWQNVVVGAALRFLYVHAPGIPWYGLWLHGAQALALLGISLSVVVLLRRQPAAYTVLTLLPLFVAGANLTVGVQFTAVAFLTGFAGVLALFALATINRRPHPMWWMVPIGFVVLSALIRFNSVLGVILVGSLLGVAALAARWPLRWPTLIVTWSIAVGLAVATFALQETWYHLSGERDEWGYGLRSHVLPGSEFPSLGEHENRILNEVGWSTNDYAMFTNWFTGDDEVFTLRIPRFYALAWSESPTPSLGMITSRAVDVARDHGPWWLIALVALAVGGGRHLRRDRLAALGFALACLVILGFVSGAARMPDRVAFPMVAFAVIGTSVLALGVTAPPRSGRSDQQRLLRGGLRAGTVLILGTLVIGAASPDMAELVSERRERAKRSAQLMDELTVTANELGHGVVFMHWVVDWWTYLDPLKASTTDPVVLSPVAGWSFQLPYRREQREALGVTDPVIAIADNPSVLIITSEERVAMLQVFLAERRGRPCTEPVLATRLDEGRRPVYRTFATMDC